MIVLTSLFYFGVLTEITSNAFQMPIVNSGTYKRQPVGTNLVMHCQNHLHKHGLPVLLPVAIFHFLCARYTGLQAGEG